MRDICPTHTLEKFLGVLLVDLDGMRTERNRSSALVVAVSLFKVDFTDPRFQGGRTMYGWSLRTSAAKGASRRSGSRVWTQTPFADGISFGVEAQAEQMHGSRGVEARQASLAGSVVRDRRTGGDVKEGHREELTLTRGVNVRIL